MLNLTVATHYCCGEVAGSKISISGKLASCGMEDNVGSHSGEGTQLRSNCCDDVVTTYNIDNNYTLLYSFLPENINYNLQIFNIPSFAYANLSAVSTIIFTDTSPPGCMMSTAVDLSSICVFRI